LSGIPAWAVRGAKVVCVDASAQPVRARPQLVKGETYIIDRAYIDVFMDDELGPYVDLDGAWGGWRLDRFRPSVENKTETEDVAMFRDLLTTHQPERERA
jgi:hypothetical protein